jgi:hypothetical protein
MLKKKRGRIKSSDRNPEFLMFLNARGFDLIARMANAHAQKERQSLLLFPTIAIEAFALELYLKCLHKIRRRSVWGHDITKLFEKLSKADKKTISKSLLEIVRQHPAYTAMCAFGVSFDAESVAKRANNAFANARYWSELNLPDADDRGHISNAGIGNFSDAIVSLISKLRPDWKERSELFRLDVPGIGRLPT